MQPQPNSYHYHSDRHNLEGVYVMRKGTVLRDSKQRPIGLPPESIQRGDIILDRQLRPLRYSERLKRHA